MKKRDRNPIRQGKGNKYYLTLFCGLLCLALSILPASVLEVRGQTTAIGSLTIDVVSLTKLDKTNRIAAKVVLENIVHPDLYFLPFGTVDDAYLIDENGQKWGQLYVKYLPEDSPPARRVVEILFEPTGTPNGSLFTLYLTRDVFQLYPDVIKDLRLEITKNSD